jgi:UDP-GlcNAc:undecaprenyl-phosphate GlcNAc-1-phosphate transferase
MGPVWARATIAAAVLTLVITPLLRRLALATGFVDQPAGRKLHTRPVPYLGGVALITSVLLAVLLEPRLPARIGVLVLGAALLGTIGLVDDHRTVAPSTRFLAQGGAALTAVAVGLRIHATGVDAVDVLITLIWIVGITNAFNLLDNMDGLAAGVSFAAAAAIFTLAILGGQTVVATVAAALAGACLAFLVYNRRPASVFMGDAGSLFLGFVIALLTVDIDPALRPPASFAVPVMLLALPVLDTTTVTLARLRHGQSVLEGGKDHLSHRLVNRGLSTGGAVVVLVGTQAALGVLAVLAGRGVIHLATAVLVAAFILGAVTVATSSATVYSTPAVGIPSRVKLATAGVVAGVAALAAPAVIGLLLARGPAGEATAVAVAALESRERAGAATTAAELQRANALFAKAADRATAPLTSLGLVIPGLSSNLRGTRVLVKTGQELTSEAAGLTSLSSADDLRPRDRGRALDELRSLAPRLERAEGVLDAARLDLASIDQPYLVPSLRRAVRDLEARVDRERTAARTIADLARILPGAGGAAGSRRYFVAYQDSSVLRATGGRVAVWGELVAEHGSLSLVRSGTVEELERGRAGTPVPAELQAALPSGSPSASDDPWGAVNATPDFRAASRLMQELYRQAGGGPVDGVVALDAVGLAALLDVIGPVTVTGDAEPLRAETLLDNLRDTGYEPGENRGARLQAIVQTVWRSFTTADVADPERLAAAVGGAVRGGHVLVDLSGPGYGEALSRLSVDGSVPPMQGDSLLVVTQNLTGVPADLDLRRRLRYDILLHPDDQPALATGRLDVVLENAARAVAGEYRTYVTVYNPLLSATGTVDGTPISVAAEERFGAPGRSAVVTVPSQQSRTLQVPLGGTVELQAGGWYRLDLRAQPTAVPADVDVTVSVPAGWRIAEVRGGATRSDERRVTGRFEGGRPQLLEVRMERTGWSRLWNGPS